MREKTAAGEHRIGEVAEMLGVNPSVLRFWETEFPQISPKRTQKGQRLYSAEDISLLRRIHHLLYERKLTIPGARRILEDCPAPSAAEDGHADALLRGLSELREILQTPII